jgi:hypothetical protein
MLPRKRQDLPSSWETTIVRLHMFLPTPAGLLAPDHYGVADWTRPAKSVGADSQRRASGVKLGRIQGLHRGEPMIPQLDILRVTADEWRQAA